jgi:hypothetical protein
MAAPHVTGVAALLKTQNGLRDWRAIRNLILSAGDEVPDLTGRTVTGRRLNAFRVLTCAGSTVCARTRPVGTLIRGSVGVPIDLAVLHVNCEAPNGEVNGRVSPGDGVITLADDGSGSDQAAGVGPARGPRDGVGAGHGDTAGGGGPFLGRWADATVDAVPGQGPIDELPAKKLFGGWGLAGETIALRRVVLSALGLAACAKAELGSEPICTPRLVVPFVPIAQGPWSGVAEPKEVVVHSVDEWRSLWREHSASADPLPTVDFTGEAVAGVFAGPCPTSGYRVEIVCVERSDRRSCQEVCK